MLPSVRMDHEVRTALLRSTANAADREFVGVLAGERTAAHWRITAVRPLPNLAPTDDAFVVDATAFAVAEGALRAEGLEWLGFVHSHPHGSPALSAIDREQLWRGCLQLLIGGGPAAGEVRAFFGDAQGWHCLPLHAADVVPSP